MTQSAAGEERRDEMDPSYPLNSATILVESENKVMKHVSRCTGINMCFERKPICQPQREG